MTGRSNDGTIAPPQNGSNPRPSVHASRSSSQEAGEHERPARGELRNVRPRPLSNLGGEPLPALVDTEVVAQALGISMRQVRRFVADGQMPFVRVGHLIRFDPDELNDWINARRAGSTEPF